MPNYYFLDGAEVRGPFALADCCLMIDRGTLLPSTLLCEEGREDWHRLDTYPQFRDNRAPVPAKEAREESILFRGHPSYWNYLGAWFWGVLLLPFGIGFLILLAAYLSRRGTTYVLTTSKAAVVTGLLVTSSREVRVSDIRSINVYRRGIAGYFGLGTVEFSSAAHDAATVFFRGILAAEDVVDAVRTMQDGRRAAPLPGCYENASKTAPALAFAVLALVPLSAAFGLRYWQVQERQRAEAVAQAQRVETVAREAREEAARQARVADEAERRRYAQEHPAATPRPAAAAPTPTPVLRRLAPPGTYYVTRYLSFRTAHGLTGFEPGHEVRLVKADAKTGFITVTDGANAVQMQPSQLTNDLDIADAIRRRDEAAQLAADQNRQANEEAAAASRLQLDLDHASHVANLPSGSVVGGHSVLDKAPEPVGGVSGGYYGGSGDDSDAVPDTSLRSLGGGQ